MVTRREMTKVFSVALATLFSGGAGPLLRAEASPALQDAHGQMANMSSDGVETLMQEPLPAMAHPEVNVITLLVPPGPTSPPHEHTGPVFAYILEGEIENQVEPGAPKRYKAGDYFYEPRMHVHRMLRNLSSTKMAKLLIFEVREKGKPFTIPVK